MDEAALDSILSRIPTIDPSSAMAMRVAWDRQDAALRRDAWRTGADAIAGTDGEDAVTLGRNAVEHWIRAAGAGGIVKTLDSSDRLGGLDARVAAAPAILDAVLAVAAGTALDQDQRHLLMAPWRAAMSDRPLLRRRARRVSSREAQPRLGTGSDGPARR
jgi:hypothetical protein